MPYKPAPFDDETHPSNRMANLRRRVNRARKFPHNTCPASRHLHLMADELMRYGAYPMIEEEPEHIAGSIYSVLESLWKARWELRKMKERFGLPDPSREEWEKFIAEQKAKRGRGGEWRG